MRPQNRPPFPIAMGVWRVVRKPQQSTLFDQLIMQQRFGLNNSVITILFACDTKVRQSPRFFLRKANRA